MRRRDETARVFATLVLITACEETGRPEERSKMNELEAAIQAIQEPVNDPAISLRRDKAIAWMLAHADEAHPRLIALLTGAPRPNAAGVAEILPQFGRAESIPVLEGLVATRDEHTAHAAAEALARHPLPEARAALERLLGSAKRNAAVAAADALFSRGDREACAALIGATKTGERDVRLHALSSAGKLGCLTAEELETYARDEDRGVREVAERLKSMKRL